MAKVFVADGVTTVACTPHILPGLYHNTGPQIRQAVASLQDTLDQAGVPLRLVTGADNHIVGDFIAGLAAGRLLTLADTRYVLVEPPHHVPPTRMEEFFFSLLMAGYVPILTHPERLTWVAAQYAMVERLVEAGVWMQITCGSVIGAFGREPKYWAERMMSEGKVHLLASDAHDVTRRPPCMGLARAAATKLLGENEATNLVEVRPHGVLANALPSALPPLPVAKVGRSSDRGPAGRRASGSQRGPARDRRGFTERLRGIFGR